MRISDWSSDVCSSDLLAADVLGPRFRVGQNALWRRDDGDAQAIANARKLLRAGIDAATRLRHARDVLDRRLALEILQLDANALHGARSEEHTSELQSLMRISYAVFCLKKKNQI